MKIEKIFLFKLIKINKKQSLAKEIFIYLIVIDTY